MNEICPVCIITAQPDELHHSFSAKIDRQFNAFGCQEFGKGFESEKNRWWKTIDFRDIVNEDFFLSLDLPIRKMGGGSYNAGKFVFIFVGSELGFESLIETVSKIRGFHSSGKILGGITDVFYYGICYYSESNVKKQKIIQINESRDKFDVLVFQSDTNFHPVKNPTGYQNFDLQHNEEWTKQFNEIVQENLVQLVFHIGLTINALYNSTSERQNILMTAGTFTLTFEPDIHQHNIATTLLKQLFPYFCTEKDDILWRDEIIADEFINSSNLASKWGWDSIYKFLVGDFETKEECIRRNKEIQKLSYKPTVSPWSLLSQWMIPVYFKKYIKSLVLNLRESAHGFMFGTLTSYNNHLSKKYHEVLSGSSDLSIVSIGKLLKNVWSENIELEKPAGLQHVLLVLEKISSFIHSQIVITEELKEQRTPPGTNFPLPDDYPLKNLPEFLSADYNDFLQHGEVIKESEKEVIESFEKLTLTKLLRLLHLHPIPLSLFTRTLILAIVSPLVVLSILKFFPDFLADTSVMKSSKGAFRLFTSCFVASFAIALLWYLLGIIQQIRNCIKKYLGWVLWKTQIKLYKITLDQQLEYYQTLASECLRIRRNIEEGFIPIGTNKKGTQDQENMDAPFPDLFPSVEAKFKEGMFQRNILGKFDDKWPILADDSLDIQIIFNKKEYSLNSFNDGKNRAILFRFLLINAKDVSIPFCQFLYEKIIFQPVEAGIEKQYFDAIRQEFCALLIERLKRIIVFKNGENIQQLLFKSNDNYPDDHCFYKNANGIFINKLIEGRYYPSVLLKNSNPYSHFSFIFPEDQNYEDRWVRVLSNARMINHHITHKSSIVSMLQTFSLNGIQDIFDREEVQTITNK